MFHTRLADCSNQIAACFNERFLDYPDNPVCEAMAYGVNGGKNLRGFLVMESARLYGIPDSQSVQVATAVEAMHAYSLVHDDLPCMDDDDLRRGRPTVHIEWDEATAVLAGDGLQSLAFELLSDEKPGLGRDVRLRLVSSLAKASGIGGMVLGQAMDISAETASAPLNLAEITELQSLKTGALISWSAQAGAILAEQDTTGMHAYSTALGLAFQIADDIIDVSGDQSKAGKQVGKDEIAGKATFVSLLGLREAKERARQLVDQAISALEPFGRDADTLRQAANFVISREM